ncbi:hypothetical protein [Aedoeadaptatus urinae]|uniref:hypothetical protein n=1 Tax=Aedoeadaptatus urinae TaxID=1871017 RepID=UPI00097DB4DF|nr:hypothetical protein [Peptoniphilus urinae]
MKKLLLFGGGLALVALAAAFCIGPYSSFAKSDGSEWKEPCLKTARNFILNDFSDFAQDEEISTNNLSKDAQKLQQFIKDKRAMNLYRCEVVGRKDVLEKATFEDEEFIDNGDGSYDVTMFVDFSFYDGKEHASVNYPYKIHLVIEEGVPKVLAAMTSDTGASWLIDGAYGNKVHKLDYDWQLPGKKNKKADAPYDLEKAKQELKADLEAPPWPGGKEEV